jgi:hypothetical protein
MHFSEYDGVWFIEGKPNAFRVLGNIEVKVGGVFTPGQLRSLDDVKRLMADQVRGKGGNAVIDFAYGQRSVGFWASLFNLDDVVWYGTGKIALIPV